MLRKLAFKPSIPSDWPMALFAPTTGSIRKRSKKENKANTAGWETKRGIWVSAWHGANFLHLHTADKESLLTVNSQFPKSNITLQASILNTIK